MLKVLCICLNAPFMSHEQCKRHGFKKKKKKKRWKTQMPAFSSVSKPTLSLKYFYFFNIGRDASLNFIHCKENF